MHNLVINTI